MDKNKGKEKLNDELPDKISGGTNNEYTGPLCQTCGNTKEFAGFTFLGYWGNIYFYKCNECGAEVYYEE